MARSREELQKAIIKKLDELTHGREVCWTLDRQTYRTSYRGLSFEMVDSGNANWLTITNPTGSIAIPDQHEEVASLLNTIQHRLFAFEVSEIAGAAAFDLDREFTSILATLT